MGGSADSAMWRIAVVDLGDVAQAVLGGFGFENLEAAAAVSEGLGGAAVDAQISREIRAEEPGPNGALVIGGVAFVGSALVFADVAGVARGESAEAVVSKEIAFDDAEDGEREVRGQDRIRQADGEDLIRTDGGVGSVGSESVAKAIRGGIPELGAEVGDGAVARFGVFGEQGESVDPEGVDLDGFAVARRDGPIADTGVHPGELRAGVAGGEQAVGWVHADLMVRAAHVPIEDVAQGGSELVVIGQLTNGFEEPERGVDGVVLGLLAAIGKAIGDQALIEVSEESADDAAGFVEAAASDEEPGEGDHGVAAPIGEPGVASNDGGFAIGAMDDEVVGGVEAAFEAEGFPVSDVFRGGAKVAFGVIPEE